MAGTRTGDNYSRVDKWYDSYAYHTDKIEQSVMLTTFLNRCGHNYRSIYRFCSTFCIYR